MFVVPPNPRVANGNIFTAPPPSGQPPMEMGNTIHQQTGQDQQLVLGEGTYTLHYDLHIATPPSHPSEAPQPNSNPLAPRVGLPSAGTQLSLVILSPRLSPSQILYRTNAARSARSIPPSISEESHSTRSENGSAFGGDSTMSQTSSPQVVGFGESNPALIPPPVKGKKDQKAKPKNNIIKSNSSFVSRVITHDTLQKKLNEHALDGIFAFANVNRSFVWLDLSSEQKTENLAKVLCTKAHALCHDVNMLTKANGHLDVVMGFNTSDIIWYEPYSQKYARLNKNGAIKKSPISKIAWLPGKENLFVAAHLDGTLVVYDKEKEDAEFLPDEPSPFDEQAAGRPRFRVLKSVQSRQQKSNPVAAWKISNTKINSIAFSPDGLHLAVVSDDGTLTIIDYLQERALDVYRSYFGALLCVTWSPDGRYILTGGQDDLVSIWSLLDRSLVARCVGHESWVTDVRFDPWRGGDERDYRFGSVGEDCRLLLWDFSVGMLGRPRAASIRPTRGSVSAAAGGGLPFPTERKPSVATITGLTVDDGAVGVTAELEPVVHPVQSKASTPTLPPVISKIVDDHPLSWLGFEEHCILTSCADGHIREWKRPTDGQ